MKRSKKYNYPYEVVRAVENYFLYNYIGISEDEVRELEPRIVLEYYLKWEGIIGYTNTILAIVTAKKGE